jgi:hypothetical protein
MPSATATDAINRHSTAASFTLRVTTAWPQATATNGKPFLRKDLFHIPFHLPHLIKEMHFVDAAE